MADNTMTNREVGRVLEEVALLLELKGENPFKIRAYAAAGRAVETLEQDLALLAGQGRLREIPGIGEALAGHITELLSTGSFRFHEELKASVPPGHVEMLAIPGLGPKKIKALFDALGARTLGELEYACLENRLAGLKGFGPRLQEKILKGVHLVRRYQGHFRYGETADAAEGLVRALESHPSVLRVSLAGSVRRRREVVRNINLVAAVTDPSDVLFGLARATEVERLLERGETGIRFALRSGIEGDLRFSTEGAFAVALLFHTGNPEHADGIRQRAFSLGFDLRRDGLFRDGRLVPADDETDLYSLLGLDFIPPELREGLGEIEAARDHRLPHLIERSDVKGIFHVHSSFSDGLASISTMVETARRMGLSYVGLSDHSRSATYAGGLTLERLEEQWAEIDRLNATFDGFRIFKGIESDILPDGSLDYDEETLRRFDFVVASVHSHFTQSREEMTRRVIAALRNPFTTILGHPTGRLLLAREPFEIDLPRVIDEAAETGTVIELNAHPMRLDLDWRLCRYAREKGVKIAISPDAHDPEGLDVIRFGAAVGRKGWLEAGDVLNTMSLPEVEAWLSRRKPN